MYLLLACDDYYPNINNCVFKGTYEECLAYKEELSVKYDRYRIIDDYRMGKQ